MRTAMLVCVRHMLQRVAACICQIMQCVAACTCPMLQSVASYVLQRVAAHVLRFVAAGRNIDNHVGCDASMHIPKPTSVAKYRS